MVIVHSKVNMMKESTSSLAKKLDEENENYEKQVIESNYKCVAFLQQIIFLITPY